MKKNLRTSSWSLWMTFGWYDLDKDLSETNNLAETFPGLTEELNQDIDLWLKKTMA